MNDLAQRGYVKNEYVCIYGQAELSSIDLVSGNQL